MTPRLSTRPVLCLLLALAFSVGLLAQVPAPEKIPRTFRILTIVGSYENLFYQPTPKAPPQTLSLGRAFSAPLSAPAGPNVEFYRLVPPPPGSPPGTPPVKHVVLTAPLDLTATETLIIARPLTPHNKQTDFQTHVIRPPEAFIAGTCLITNLSGFSSAAVALKKNVHNIDNGVTSLVSFDRGHNPIKVAVHVQNNDKWLLAGDDAWRLNESYRGYIVILPYIEDPDYPPPLQAPPAIVRINFETSPEVLRAKLAAQK